MNKHDCLFLISGEQEKSKFYFLHCLSGFDTIFFSKLHLPASNPALPPNSFASFLFPLSLEFVARKIYQCPTIYPSTAVYRTISVGWKPADVNKNGVPLLDLLMYSCTILSKPLVQKIN